MDVREHAKVFFVRHISKSNSNIALACIQSLYWGGGRHSEQIVDGSTVCSNPQINLVTFATTFTVYPTHVEYCRRLKFVFFVCPYTRSSFCVGLFFLLVPKMYIQFLYKAGFKLD